MTDTVTSSDDHFAGQGFSSGGGDLQAPSSGKESLRDSDPQSATLFATDRHTHVLMRPRGPRREKSARPRLARFRPARFVLTVAPLSRIDGPIESAKPTVAGGSRPAAIRRQLERG